MGVLPERERPKRVLCQEITKSWKKIKRRENIC